MTEKMSSNSSLSIKKAPKAAAVAALSAMMAFNVCPAEAFQPFLVVPSSRMMHRSPSFSSTLAPAAVTMDCTPWDVECYGVHPLGSRIGGLQWRRQMKQRQPGRVIFAPEDLFQGPAVRPQQEFAISDPTVTQDTDDLYTLTFDLPADVDHDGLEVSVSGRLLTVKACVTREGDNGPSATRGGWVTRPSRMDSVSRSFVLPEGLSESGATASLFSNGKAEVKFAKDQAVGGAAATATTATAPSKADPTVPANKAAAAPASSYAEYLAGLSGALRSAVAAAAAASDNAPAAAGTPTASSTAGTPASGVEQPASLSDSPFDALDQEFREFAKAMWGEEAVEPLQIPTQKQLAEKAAAAKEARAKREAEVAVRTKAAEEAKAKREAEFAQRVKAAEEAKAKREAEFAERVKAAKEARENRVVAMRRATMASDVSEVEDGSSYVVKVALPEGVTRDTVKLTANPNSSLRVTVSATAAEGGRSIYKDVFLPKDAVIGEISAKFETEQQDDRKTKNKEGVEGASDVSGAHAVSGLEVTVGRAAAPQPKTISIL